FLVGLYPELDGPRDQCLRHTRIVVDLHVDEPVSYIMLEPLEVPGLCRPSFTYDEDAVLRLAEWRAAPERLVVIATATCHQPSSPLSGARMKGLRNGTAP